MSGALVGIGRLRIRRMLAAALLAAMSPTLGWTADALTVAVDQATLMRMPDRVATVVVGNPLIADVSLQAAGLAVVTGKAYGVTNLLALDRSGAVLMDREVQVQGPRDPLVVVYKGVERESYSCTPTCQRRITLGDGTGFFDATLGQSGNRNGQATNAAQTAR
jgi:hypothetical protein